MRLNRLDLVRYGRFQDAEIPFPRPGAGVPDVTVVFGENESGKSTAFNGFLELLFGFKVGVHPYAFRFGRSDLLVGAELDLPGRGVTVLRRNSKPARSLLDGDGRPISEVTLSGSLHGLRRDIYEERFSLNEQGLREGGQRIAKAQGDLGQLLHAGLSGLTGMAEALDSLASRADRFHKKHGRNTALKTGKERLKEIASEVRAGLLTADQAKRLRRDRDRLSAEFATMDAKLIEASKRQLASRAAEIWHQRTQRFDELTKALDAFPEGEDLGPSIPTRVAALVEKISAQASKVAEADEGIAMQDQIIAEHPVDTVGQRLATELEHLDNLEIDDAPLMGRASTAWADLKQRRDARDAIKVQMDDMIRRLDAPDADQLVRALESIDLEELANAVKACLTAKQAADAATATLEMARDQHGEEPDEPKDLTALRTVLEGWKAVADLSLYKAREREAAERYEKVIAALPDGWRGLIAAGLPAPEVLSEAAKDRSTLTAEMAASQSDLEARESDLAEARARLGALEDAPDAIDIGKTEESRRQRDLLWGRHREILTQETADRFEAAMHADDDARAHYLTGAEARQRLAAAREQFKRIEAQHENAKKRHDVLIANLESHATHCSHLATALGMEDTTTPAAFGPRQLALTVAADAAAELTNAKRSLAEKIEHQDAAKTALIDEARQFGLDPSGTEPSAQVERILALEDTDRKAWTQWQDAKKKVTKLENKAAQCRHEVVEADAQFGRMTAGLPLPDCSPHGIESALPHLRTLVRLRGEYQAMLTRIESLEQAIELLKERALSLSDIMENEEIDANTDPIKVVESARSRVAVANKTEQRRSEATSLREDLVKSKRQAETEHQNAQKALAACFEGQGGQALDPLDRLDRLVERDQLRTERSAADRERQDAKDGVDADAFAAELDHMPDANRGTELEQLRMDAQINRDAARDAHREAERVYRDAFEAAERADLVTEQATLLEELRDQARQAAVARLGVLAARGALRQLAAERRSHMLSDVEKAFVSMTAPAWSGVDVWTQSEGEKLVGIRSDGAPVPVDQMSTGTIGQLYFALRLAGYRSFALDPGPLPMILDDIMETFDDTRARAALRLCAEIGASNGQAILFTHHAHLVELARDSIDGVAIVEMAECQGSNATYQ